MNFKIICEIVFAISVYFYSIKIIIIIILPTYVPINLTVNTFNQSS